MDDPLQTNELRPKQSRTLPLRILYVLGAIIFLLGFYVFACSAPSDFPVGAIVKIEYGSSLRSISQTLKEDHIIRSRAVFETVSMLFGDEHHIQSADYLFNEKLSVFSVARRVVGGFHHLPSILLTIPEGFDREQIADTASRRLVNFNTQSFLQKTENKEGYLFPDTYFLLNNANEDDVINSLSANFKKKTSDLNTKIAVSGRTLREIIVMASLIEREARGDLDREVIAGILWKRISIGMALQVDAAPETYKIRGLPKNPICNPGLLAIKAAIHPQISPYLYYLHDSNGMIHYAKTFAEHTANKAKYLK